MSLVLLETEEKKFARNFRDARGYHKRAVQFATDEERPSLVFNVASVAIECYLIALCAYYREMPYNHNYGSLMETAESVAEFDPNLSRDIRALDEIFGICSLENYYHGTPEKSDAERALGICHRLCTMFEALGISPVQNEAA